MRNPEHSAFGVAELAKSSESIATVVGTFSKFRYLSLIFFGAVSFLSAQEKRSSFWTEVEPHLGEITDTTWRIQFFQLDEIEKLPDGAREMATEHVISQWTKKNLAAAFQYAGSKSRYGRFATLKNISYYGAVSNPEETLRISGRLRGRYFGTGTGSEFFPGLSEVIRQKKRAAIPMLQKYGWLANDDEFAAIELNHFGGSEIDVSEMVEELCALDPKNLDWLLEHHPEFGDALLLRGAIRARARKTRDPYITGVMEVNTNFIFWPTPRETKIARQLLLEKDPVKGLAQLHGKMKRGFRISFASLFAREWIASDPIAFLKWYQEDDHYEWLCNVFTSHYVKTAIEPIADKSKKQALEVVAQLEHSGVQSTASRALYKWLIRNQHPNPTTFLASAGKDWLSQSALALAWDDAIKSDPEKFLEFLRENPDGALHELAGKFVMARAGPDALFSQLVTRQSNKDDKQIINLLIRIFIEAHPERGTEVIALLPEPLRPMAAHAVFEHTPFNDPAVHLELLKSIPAGNFRDHAYRKIASQWASQLPEEAMKWALTLPAEGTLRNAILNDIRKQWQQFSPLP